MATLDRSAAQAADPRENVVHSVATNIEVTIHDSDPVSSDEHCSFFGSTQNELRVSDGSRQLGPGLPGITHPTSSGPFVDTAGTPITFECDEYVACFSDTTNGPAALGEAAVEAFVSGLVRVTVPYAFEDVSGTFGNHPPCEDDVGVQYGTIVLEALPGRHECLDALPSWYDGSNYVEVNQFCITNDFTRTPPVAQGGATRSGGPAPLAVTLDASASYDPDGYIVEYEWEFGDGHRRVTTVPTTNYTYSTPGTYFPLVTVRDHTGLTDRVGLTYGIEVRDGSPPSTEATYGQVDAVLVGPSSADVHEVVTFDASRSVTHGGQIVAYLWDFGDGSPVITTSGPTVDHAFGLPDIVTVEVTVENDLGRTGQASLRLNVYFPSPDDAG